MPLIDSWCLNLAFIGISSDGGYTRGMDPVPSVSGLWCSRAALTTPWSDDRGQLALALLGWRLICSDEAAQMDSAIDLRAILVGDMPVPKRSPDPKDDLILATAVAGQAALLATGDKRDILALGTVEGRVDSLLSLSCWLLLLYLPSQPNLQTVQMLPWKESLVLKHTGDDARSDALIVSEFLNDVRAAW